MDGFEFAEELECPTNCQSVADWIESRRQGEPLNPNAHRFERRQALQEAPISSVRGIYEIEPVLLQPSNPIQQFDYVPSDSGISGLHDVHDMRKTGAYRDRAFIPMDFRRSSQIGGALVRPVTAQHDGNRLDQDLGIQGQGAPSD